MGSLGAAEMIILIIVLIAIPAGLGIALIWYVLSRSKSPKQTNRKGMPRSVEERLSEIDSLLAQNLISKVEHEEKRRQILSDI